jgi:predicted phage terminase large subunit-like protein
VSASTLAELEALAKTLTGASDRNLLAAVDRTIARHRATASPLHYALWATRNRANKAVPYDWVTLLNRNLADLAARRITGLLVEAPVRHGKSFMGSRFFPAWYLGEHPHHRVLWTGHNQSFVRRMGRSVRDLFLDPETNPWGHQIRPDSRAADRFDFVGLEGGYSAYGVGIPPTGSGGNLIGVDDPIKSREQANSLLQRDGLWEWFTSDITSRLEPHGAILVIMSRWHEDDLLGRIKKRQDDPAFGGRRWTVLHLPGLADPALVDPDPLGRAPGQALCPERYDEAALAALRADMGVLNFDSLVQGAPHPAEGFLFKRHNWRYVDGVPLNLAWERWWDFAASEKKTADWTAGVLLARDTDGRTYIADVRRIQAEPAGVKAFIRATTIEDLTKWQCQEVGLPLDPAQAGKAQEQDYLSTVFHDLPVRARFEPQTGDKVTRANPLAGQQGANLVHILNGIPNLDEFLAEMGAFPFGSHDDWVDAAAMGYASVAGLLGRRARLL